MFAPSKTELLRGHPICAQTAARSSALSGQRGPRSSVRRRTGFLNASGLHGVSVVPRESPTPEEGKRQGPGPASLGGCSGMGLKAKSCSANVQLRKEASSTLPLPCLSLLG